MNTLKFERNQFEKDLETTQISLTKKTTENQVNSMLYSCVCLREFSLGTRKNLSAREKTSINTRKYH